jgi:hypothetical protein
VKVKRETNKVDRAKRMHCVRSERAIAVPFVVRRLQRQSACAQPSLQAGYRISARCVRLALSTLFVSLFTSYKCYYAKWLNLMCTGHSLIGLNFMLQDIQIVNYTIPSISFNAVITEVMNLITFGTIDNAVFIPFAYC